MDKWIEHHHKNKPKKTKQNKTKNEKKTKKNRNRNKRNYNEITTFKMQYLFFFRSFTLSLMITIMLVS